MASFLARVDSGGIMECSWAPGAAPKSGVQFFPAGNPPSCPHGAGGGVSEGRRTALPLPEPEPPYIPAPCLLLAPG